MRVNLGDMEANPELTAQVTFRLSQETLEALKRRAAKEQRKLADVIRRIVTKAVEVK